MADWLIRGGLDNEAAEHDIPMSRIAPAIRGYGSSAAAATSVTTAAGDRLWISAYSHLRIYDQLYCFKLYSHKIRSTVPLILSHWVISILKGAAEAPSEDAASSVCP